MSEYVLEARDLRKQFQQANEKIQVLDGVNLFVGAGECVAIIGASGTGKSTLLNLLGGLDAPDHGEVQLMQQAFSCCDPTTRGLMRNRHLGFVYQFHHLLPEFSALENVAMPLMIAGKKKSYALETATGLLDEVGLVHRLTHRPSQLSGGERQRVAIARALACQPECVLMDEPTGNLDTDNANAIHALMKKLNVAHGTSFVIVTHDESLAQQMHRVLCLEHGQLN